MELARLGTEQMKGSEGAGQAGQCPVTDLGCEVDFLRKQMGRRNRQGTGAGGAVGSGEVTLCCPWCGILVTMHRAPEVPPFPWTPPTPCSADATPHTVTQCPHRRVSQPEGDPKPAPESSDLRGGTSSA